MMSNSARNSAEQPSILSLNKSTVVVWVAISLIVVETFSGALRFYFDQIGISALLYLPKIACLSLFALELLTFKASRMLWLGLLLLLISSQLAMLHGASVSNVAFSLFGITPLLFGLTCSDYLLHRKRLFCWAIGLCLLASLVGILLDKYFSVPWKGYSYTLGNTELSGNTAWSADEADRIAGFARVSNGLSIIIAIYSLYLAMFLRSKVLLCGLCAVAFYSIILTTSKAPAAAFVITLGLLAVTRLRWTSALIFVAAIVIGLSLPIAGLIFSFDPNAITSGDSSLSSLYDRLINTWPNLVEYMHNQGWSLTGAGFGMFGSSQVLFPVPGAGLLTGSDSNAMYLWVTFGVVGLALYVLQLPLLFILRDKTTPMDRALLAINFCICVTGWTTDMFEVPVSTLFLGLAIGQVLCNSVNTSVAATPAQDLGDLSGLTELR